MIALVLALATCEPALGDEDDVVVTGVRDPVKKSYRRMVEGQQLFRERKQLAPEATLRYKLLPRSPKTQMKDLELDVSAASFSFPVKVAPDGTFALEYNARAEKEDAQVMSNRKAGSMTWRTDVRTPGLPPNVRRLGDLRLECEVGMKSGLISPYPPGFFGWLEELLVTRGPEFCHRDNPRYLFFAERPLFSVTLAHGERRWTVPVEMLWGAAVRDPKWKQDRWCDCQAIFDRTYFLPLGDGSWPDDTRVEIETMDAPGSQPIFDPGRDTKKDVLAALGPGAIVDFPSGYEVWVYREEPDAKNAKAKDAPRPELLLLFNPSGVLQKARKR